VVDLLCTVRGCGDALARRAATWRCPRGHSFDVARSGYVNLLQPGDRRSLAAGDTLAAAAARERLELRGIGEELRAAVEERVAALSLPSGAAALDVGAGTGATLARLSGAFGLEGWALDLSAPAAERGARRHPELAWVVANADRGLPFQARSFALLVSSTGPKNPAEFRRALAPTGALLLVVPAPDDLVELRAAVLGQGELLDRAARALALFADDFTVAGRAVARATRVLERAQIEDVLAATYRGARRRERARLAGLESLRTTFAAELLHLVPRDLDPRIGAGGGHGP